MVYTISEYSKKQAKKLGVEITISSNPKKKLDVFKDGKKIASIGATGYKDYATTKDKERRRLYRLRHKGEEKVIGSPGYWAWNLLW
jgi:D-arabinose 1-dehydrogenase-like Zn-dependent alcohol dehydrogenase